MRAARLIRMVLLLQARASMTAAELARELEVSERTVTRDAQALSEAGVPVYADRGRVGGYRLVGGYRTRLTGLDRGEAEALFLSGVPGALREMGLEDAASAARLKVSAALMPSLRGASRTAAQRFHLDAPGWFHAPKAPALLPAVADAVWDDRRITARYRQGGGVSPGSGEGEDARPAEVERVLEPYGLVLKAGVWYLCARADTGAYRVYRIDRFTAVAAGAERFDRDGEFDLPGFWAERGAQFARALLRTSAVVRLSAEGARLLRHAVGAAAAGEALAEPGEPDARGRVTVTVPVESDEVAYSQLLMLGPEAEVLAPPALRRRFTDATERMARHYR
ncbi:helix-turn-helix transcriptional regulator [Streptomyces uncialis]|uniref:helix-turn-helix transcriptional regulator n=1 Tax=Streptomyces uncialis TaxID=1048205 RepID=UPI002257C2B5|nr:WYL domain-containing protein [Streptomyces uncialis]MCX4663342.1 WYL domain-containing protein [Streptomyces uncialis]WTE10462.1 WYL domain-containing protein [Streptomyces uncialis]